ncbi:unnamed protein product [Amoebophrya sp. A25]|nr:unnamed protein product [Amoebophrya sp. A25]|eukprot:GSA25T00012587001.1
MEAASFELLEDADAGTIFELFEDWRDPSDEVLEQVRALASRPGGNERRGVGAAPKPKQGSATNNANSSSSSSSSTSTSASDLNRKSSASGTSNDNNAAVDSKAAGALKKKLRRLAKNKEEEYDLKGEGSMMKMASSSTQGRGEQCGTRSSEIHPSTDPAETSMNIPVHLENPPLPGRKKTALELAMEARKAVVQKQGKKKRKK